MTPAAIYKKTEILTSNKVTVVVKLYEGAVKFLKLAIADIQNNDFESKNIHIQKAINIVTELNFALDMEQGELSQNLRNLYNFIIAHLRQANIDIDRDKIASVIAILQELNDGWKKIAV